MATFIIRRLLWMVVSLIVISLITFIIFYTLPAADPATLRAGKQPSPELIASIKESLGLDQPWYVQYGKYMKNLVLHFDFGYSYQNNVSVRSQIFDRLPATVTLALGGAICWLLIGIPIGIVSALKRGKWQDRLTMGAALVAISAPVYWLGLVALYLFSKDLGKFKIFDGQGTYPPDGTILSHPVGVISALILPSLVLAASFAAVYARFVRANLVETMGEDYIRTARAKGLPERTVVVKHGLRSTLTPILTIFGLDLGLLLGGAVLTESTYSLPGIGQYAVQAIVNQDLPKVLGVTLVGAGFIVLANLVVDILYAVIDPRVRLS